MITECIQQPLRIHHTVSQHFNYFTIHDIAHYRRIPHFPPLDSTYFADLTHDNNDYTTIYDIRNHIKAVASLWQYRNELRNSLGQHGGFPSPHGSCRGASNPPPTNGDWQWRGLLLASAHGSELLHRLRVRGYLIPFVELRDVLYIGPLLTLVGEMRTCAVSRCT